MIGVSSVIGVGIFVVSGVTAAQNTGPAITLSFLLASLAVLVVALCYCELAAMMPVAGSSYSYVAESLGRFPAWLVAWAMLLEYLISVSAVASGWSGYLTGLLAKIGLGLSASVTHAPLTLDDHLAFSWTGDYGNFPAALFTLAVTGLLAAGIRESARVNNLVALLKIGVILVVVGVGAFYVDPANWHPFIPDNSGEWGHFGLSGMMRGTAIAVWVYIGFETISTCAQEAKNPKRDLAIGMLATMAICTVLYLAISLVMTGLVPSSRLGVPDPVVVALDAIGPQWSWLVTLVSIGALVGIGSTLLATLYGQIRIFYIMARDGQLPKSFALIHPRYRTPVIATWATGGICAAISFLLPIDMLAELVSMGTLLAFAAVCAAVLVFRHLQPDRERPFRLWGSPFIPALGVVICLGLMASMPLRSWVQLIGWMALGAGLYRRPGSGRGKRTR
jgi:APA family basic amino acid/polyamine antiporter